MKIKSISIRTTLAAAAGTILLTGCATPYGENAQVGLETGAVQSQLSTWPLSTPRQLVRWSGYYSNMKSMPVLRTLETLALTAPEGAGAGLDQATVFANMPPGTIFVEPAGAGTDLYLHRPGQR